MTSARPGRLPALVLLLAVLAVLGVAPGAHADASTAATADDGAAVVAQRWLDARTLDLTVDSPALHTTAPVRVLLPTGWAAHPDRTWPVLYLLQGAHDDYTSWTRETDVESFTAGKGLITVMPSTGPTGIPTRWWGHGQANAPDYETFTLVEVEQLLQRGFRASSVRAVAGVSTGGYGALALAARHPGTFTAAASYSGILDTTFPAMPQVIYAIVAREQLDPTSLWGDPLLQAPLWQAGNPYDRISGLRGTALYLSSGSGIPAPASGPLPGILEGALWPAALAFRARLAALGIPATTHFYSGGGHDWEWWTPEFHASWPVLAGGLGIPAS